MTVATYQWTVERYHQAIALGIFDDESVELIKGSLVLMAPEGEPHAVYSTATADYLRQLLGTRATIRDGKPITLPNLSEPEPDIAIVRPPIWAYLEHHPYPEDICWVIEYSNTSLEKDLGIKKEAYAEAGIQEYWVVNLKQLSLKVLREPTGSNYAYEQTLTTGIVLPLAFPDIAVDVRRLLSRKG